MTRGDTMSTQSPRAAMWPISSPGLSGPRKAPFSRGGAGHPQAQTRRGRSFEDPRTRVRNQEGRLSSGEEEELDAYRRVGRLMDLLLAKARRSLKRTGLDNTSSGDE